MRIKLLDQYEVEVGDLYPQLASSLFTIEDAINVWLTFDEGKEVDGCSSFGVAIPARDYTEEEFVLMVRAKGEFALSSIMKKASEDRVKVSAREDSRKALNKLTADLGDKFGITYRLNTR